MNKTAAAFLLTFGLLGSAHAAAPKAAKPGHRTSKPAPVAPKPALHPLQNQIRGFWVSSDGEDQRWEFQPSKGNTGILYAWYRDISYHKRPYILQGKNRMFLPQLKMNVTVTFRRGEMILTEGKEVLRFKRMT